MEDGVNETLTVFFQDAVHLITCGLEPFIGFIAGDGTPLTVTKTYLIWRVGKDEIDSVIRKAGHDMDAVTQNQTGHDISPFSNAAPVTPCRYDSRAKSGADKGTTASRSADKSRRWLDGLTAKIEPENDGKTAENAF